MPQISKIRIVNFQYNDGKRLIADELYDFESENKGPSDVLINLANGGGKSVLVQLMMQPIIPKAKVAGRRIESFFTKTTDHCFIAVEWALDGSKTKLMTGIAMAASDSSRDADQERGFQIKYYTFVSSYQDYQGNYDIISLPLSRKENGRYIPASFDDIRNIAKKSNGKLDRYSSDDSVKWQERLSEYGIIQSEWRMIEELNSNEDGLSKYFSNLKTSDAVIDKLIIPRIEDKKSNGVSRDDSSLETMLISYAKQFSKQQDIIKEREICSGFYTMLEKTRADAEQLWKENDSLEKCIETLFAYYDALLAEITAQRNKEEKLTGEKANLNRIIHHIQWEKISADYYTCKEAFERETASLNESESNRAAAKDRLDEARKKLLLIECAHYFKQLTEIENQISAITTEITNRESNSESAGRLASLKYSAYLAVKEELQRITPEIKSCTSEKEAFIESVSAIEKQLSEVQSAIVTAKEIKDKADAVYEKQQKDNDDIAQEIGFTAYRMLDGKYQESDLEDWKLAVSEKERSLLSSISDIQEELHSFEDRVGVLPQEISDSNNQLQSINNDLEQVKRETEEFIYAKEQVLTIFNKHSLSQEMLFTNHAVSFLEEQIAEVHESISETRRKIEATEEAIAAVNRGTLHIPKIISDFLDNTGIRYTSVERYILTQQAKGFLSVDDCRQILDKYPFAAYGIIVEENDIETIFQETSDRWLPAVVPIFTAADVGKLMEGEASAPALLSAYDKEYFNDSEIYEERLKRSLDDQQYRMGLLEKRDASLREDLTTVECFKTYDAGWENRSLDKKTKLEERIAKQQDQIEKLKQEQKELKQRISKDREDESSLRKDLIATQTRISLFEKLLMKLEEENSLSRDCEIASRKLQELMDDQEAMKANKINEDEQLRKTTERLKELEQEDQLLRTGIAVVNDAATAEIVPGEWEALLAQYKALLAAQSADLKRLNDDRTRLQTEKEEKQKEIQKRNCKQDEYEDIVYSEEFEAEATDGVKIAESIFQDADSVYNSIGKSQSRAAASFEIAAKGLTDFGGEALPIEEVGKSFDSRITEAQIRIADIDSDLKSVADVLSQLQKIHGKTENVIEQYARPAKFNSIILDKDYNTQLNTLTGQIRELNNLITTRKRSVEDTLKKMASEYGSKSTDISLAIASMQELLSNAVIRGDRYYTLCEHIDANMHTAELRISQIDTDLKEFNKTKGDLIHQCVIQGRQIYEGLMQLSSNSKIKVQDRRRQMIQFDIPDGVDEKLATVAISSEIEKGAIEIADKLLEDSYMESDIRKIANRIVGSKRLLRKYINQENIILKAYKIDRNPDNSGYRSWEQTQVQNSGAEKFVVYFAVILALMTYARDGQDDLGGKNNRSVLILDNPFGPISSKHVLEPMFEISRNYKVQMICLSDISKSDIVSCFDLVIRAVVKQFAFSNKEQLTHEGNEMIEHGYYRSEQVNLF